MRKRVWIILTGVCVLLLCIVSMYVFRYGLFPQAEPVDPATQSPGANGESDVQEPDGTDEDSVGMRVLINGQAPFTFAKSPVFDGETLWLPGSEIMRLFDYPNIYIDSQNLICNYYDSEGGYKNCFYQEGTPQYSIDTDAEVFEQASAAPYYTEGEFFIPEDAMEALTGDIFTYDSRENTLHLIFNGYTEMQTGNKHPVQKIVLKKPYELNDNRICDLISTLCLYDDQWDMSGFEHAATQSTGWTWFSAAINNQDWYEDNWDVPDFYLTDKIERFYQAADEYGLRLTYNLIFKDKAYLGQSNQTGPGSLSDPAQVERYLAFIEEVVTHFKGVVDCYEIWNESNIGNSPQYVSAEDYIAVVKQAYPLIKSIDPDAIVSIGHTTSYQEEYSQAYMDALVSSDVVRYCDRITIHPFFYVSPEHYPEYYYHYPEIVGEMKAKAIENGFQGDFWGSEGNYHPTEHVAPEDAYMMAAYTETVSAKYVQRVNAMNIGLGLSGGTMGTNNYPISVNAIGRSALLLSGVRAADHGIDIDTDVSPVRSFSYDVDMGTLFSYWNDGTATDEDQVAYCDILLDAAGCEHVYAYDVLQGLYTELDFSVEDGGIAIRNAVLKDYPIYLLVN